MRRTTRRTTAARIGLSSLLLAGSWAAFGLTPAATAAPDPAPVASGAVLAGMERDLDLTPAEAKARLAAEKEATAVEKKAQRAAGAAYGGSWFDADKGALVVAVSDRAAADAVTGVGASVRLVEHSAKTLDAAKERIDGLDAPRGVAGWRVDPQANSVVVSVVGDQADGKAVRGFVERARAAGPVEVETVAAAPETFAAGTVGGDPYYTGNVRCSIGFSVHGGFVTAGHCGPTGQGVRGWDNSTIGSFRGSSFPGDDMAYVSVGNGWWTVPVVLGWGTVSDQLVRGSAEAPVGASICRSGSTTHWHCGTVLAKNETVNYSQGAVHQMTKTSVCAEGGDSGGSFISGDQAQGVTSGGWGNCSGGGETWYQPVNEILGRYGLTLHTA
ncbi:peptidase S1 [Streptomyces sp. 604F]|uniref:S1 family peptidase n=1 Tax=Streptomyces sp. 604F TaxID=1476754 RepID=UPI001398A958|nr:S1 family peptidase [Streptomyces sp. 604F]MBP3081145.1 peptidase S1 [Streptomyces sp. 604F]QHV83935.1 serine protease [Streptomyces sp. 604F]